jgi:hypothetical protein
MTGRQVGGSAPHLDLYYSTQDNDIKGSSDGGATWNGSLCCEGAYLQADRANPAMEDTRVTGHSCDNCMNFDVQKHLGNGGQGPFHNTKPDAQAPFQLVGPNYLQGIVVDTTTEYWLTGDRGSSWNLSFTAPGAFVAPILFSGDLANPVTYVAIDRGGTGAHLFRASAVSGTVTVRVADSIGMQKIGVMGTGQSRYAVVGVDPKNPDHLLAQDVFTGTKASRDGGITWFRIPALDSAASDSGRYLPSMNWFPSVTTISWDPTNSCHILIGTMQNGVIRSADGGRTWAQVRGSKNATIVTSFFFPPSGPIWMSTYGRGLWRINVDRAAPPSSRCEFPRPPGDMAQPEPTSVMLRIGGTSRPFRGLSDSVICATCTVFVVYDGWITDVEGDPAVRAVATSSGHVEQRRADGREAPVTIANSFRDAESERLRARLRREITDERHVRGLVLDGTRLVAFLVGSTPLPIAPVRNPAVIARSIGSDSVLVRGFNFLTGQGERGVTVLVAQDTVTRDVRVGADGRFEARIRMQRRAPGFVIVTVLQRDGLRTTLATASLQIVSRESDQTTRRQ